MAAIGRPLPPLPDPRCQLPRLHPGDLEATTRMVVCETTMIVFLLAGGFGPGAGSVNSQSTFAEARAFLEGRACRLVLRLPEHVVNVVLCTWTPAPGPRSQESTGQVPVSPFLLAPARATSPGPPTTTTF